MRLLLILMLVAVSLSAQAADPKVPVLSEANKLKIQLIELQAENIQLKMQQAAAQLAKLETDSKQFFQSLVVDGYRLERGTDGQWGYLPVKQDGER